MYKIKPINMICIIIFSLLVIGPIYSWGAILFSDNFDGHADWSPTQLLTAVNCGVGCATAPTGYAGYRLQGSSYAAPGNNTLNIDATNFRGSSGKALTYWNEVCDSCGWTSDGLLNVELNSAGYTELYIRFYIKFQPGWQWNTATSPQQKFIHISYYEGGDPFTYFAAGNHQPVFIGDLAKWASGASDISYYSAYRYTNVYYPDAATPSHVRDESTYFPGGSYGGGGTDFWTAGMMGDGSWHSWEFYLKANSAAGVADGIHRFWQDGVLIANVTDLAWQDTGAAVQRLWNYVQIGGNNYNHYAPQSGAPEQWYAIDDLVISESYIGPGPVGGYVVADEIPVVPTGPTGPVSQATDGSGTVTIKFKVLDANDNADITLSTFEYSIDNGSTWTVPTGGDTSTALSPTSAWASTIYLSNQYSVINGTSGEWGGATIYNFTVETKDIIEFAALNSYDGNVKFRFYVNNDNSPSSSPVETDSFSLDNLAPKKISPAPTIN